MYVLRNSRKKMERDLVFKVKVCFACTVEGESGLVILCCRQEWKRTQWKCREGKSTGESVVVNYEMKVKIFVLGWSSKKG